MPGGSVASKPTPRTPPVKSVGAGITVANRAPFAVPASANAPAEAPLFIFTTPVIVPAAAAPQAAGIKPVHEPDGETPRFPVMTVSPKVVGLDTSVCAMTAYGAAVPRGVPRGMPSADARGESMAPKRPTVITARANKEKLWGLISFSLRICRTSVTPPAETGSRTPYFRICQIQNLFKIEQVLGQGPRVGLTGDR